MSGRPEEQSNTTHATQRSQSGESLVDQGEWVNCWVCEDVFRRRIQTKRTCAKCRRGFVKGGMEVSIEATELVLSVGQTRTLDSDARPALGLRARQFSFWLPRLMGPRLSFGVGTD
jgi:hypothetical protein